MTRKHVVPFLLFLLTVTVALVLGADVAHAAGEAGNFSCSNGHATGKLFTSTTACPTVLRFDNLFSFLVCNMEQLSSNLMGAMFCGMISNLAPAVSAILVLATVIFGIGFTIGVIPATAREFQLFLLKVAFVWVFATQSDYLLRYGYAFFVNGIRDGVAIVLTGYNTTATGTTSSVYSQIDGILAQMIKFATDYIGIDKTKTTDDCGNAMFAVMGVMAIAFPPIFFTAIALLMRVGITFLHAVFAYVYSLVGIAFLLCLAPFFLSFFMFRQTRPFFDKWIGYMASFALQIVLLFAFLAAVLSFNPSTVSTNISDLIMKKTEAKEGGSFRAPWEYCTICDFETVDAVTNQPIADNKSGDFLSKGKLRCKNPKVAIGVDTTVSPNKGQMGTLLKFGGSGFMALLVLAYVLEGLLGYVPSLAQILASSLGGASYAPQLGGGISPRGSPSVDVPFGGAVRDFEVGMSEGYAVNKVDEHGNATARDSISRTAEGLRRGFGRAIEGKTEYDQYGKDGKVIRKTGDVRGIDNSGSRAGEAGFKNRFVDWLVDPNHLNRQ